MAPPLDLGQQFLIDFGQHFFIDVFPPTDPWDTHVNPAEWKDSVFKQLLKISCNYTATKNRYTIAP